MALVESFKAALGEYTVKDEKYGISFSKVIAERKAFLSKKKLEYSGKIKINEETKEVVFSDMLKESGSGLSMGSDSDMSSGFGFSASTYSMGGNGRSGTIEEQSTLFGKTYSYTFEYEEVRTMVEELCKKEGYTFKYSIF
ncbi:ribonucleoside-triphosphate reductase [Candidatus Dojkabacteria bacterium CG_4_9_14_3_um_filter_150_Dojkabacteria_WS6_41_13]|uniref:Ribonucleoside-triphosphate reductase n=1 Tax=Candidatus Dojkabacteria bacterium CG_4_10_14_0_2_um_filter_Dojkabacteria_WS6_41_15 TaxID=2014249 RepID=A0A2M7W2M4_9BACT|nr:MAG: ribonucleoside-triphosphate reductase [Candidatus Dojkabacteria bacterium CG_4_10_14_3_um_filter_Dojkabacteria_WS6_41_9]PJA15067.1 MAG: ribonucleoside-triphosphate reductase [Candidatus Dojkabacteria bacterium CG_4_10_14_0_2_um_filter_Dojkabacteria_WS6_41_15]PJB22807.1 MAG: ribonucleoside-triphosphate reductase [Candidatus Dojkabacteria bacterium CG_4_9_14_3_um_filter_150_Dojkabacteria_WS6_41_13]